MISNDRNSTAERLDTEVAIIGVPHPKWQEVGRAIVVIKEDHSLTEQEVIDFCQGKLARYKIPKSVVFVDVLPRTAAGKVLKRELRKQWPSEIITTTEREVV